MVLSRRELLVAGGAGALLAACGGGGGKGETSTEAAATKKKGLLAYAAFDIEQPAGRALRLPLGLASAADGSLDLAHPPSAVQVALRSPTGVTTDLGRVVRHGKGVPRSYWPMRATLPTPGDWTFLVTAEGQELTVDITARSEAQLDELKRLLPWPGDVLPRIVTPTVADTREVVDICTRTPACPFHSVTLDQAIGRRRGPIVFLVSTPAYCQTAICGPVLDLLIARRRQLEAAGATVIHAEVYADDKARVTSDTVNRLGLTYEPALFLAAPDGTVSERLDYTFDATELSGALSRLLP